MSKSREDLDVLEICWKPVREDPQNFDAWTQLLQCVEQMDETKPAREAYEKFLEKYPYCYGYWKKFAELERRHKHVEKSIEVYERGVIAIALSVDLWLAYIEFYKDFVKDSEVRERRIRYLYERSISAAGLEFRSDKLWEDYIKWEETNKNFPQVIAIYDRLLKIPTLMYSTHFDRLQEFVNSQPPDKILAESEYDEYYKEIEIRMKEKNEEVYVVEEVPQEELKLETDEKEKEEEEDADKTIPTEYRKRYNDEALKYFRVAILEKRRKIHLYNEQEVSKRWHYEDGIKRPYFHVKPLERAQLKNWRNYLDFEIQEGIHERITVLFERCLIACALYEDIWIRYARYMEKKEVESAREVYKRACTVHVAKKPNPHLAWSAFEEKKGEFEAAKDVLYDFEKRCPGLLTIQFRKIGIDRRQAVADAPKFEPEEAEATKSVDYSTVCARYEKLLRDPKTPLKAASFYAMKFARFQAKVRKDRKLAEKILLDALFRDGENGQLHLQLVDLAYNAEKMVESEVIAAFDRALKSNLPDTEKLLFSRRKLEFLEDFCYDISNLQEHFEYHQKLYKSLGISSGKRKAEEPRKDTNDKRFRADAVAPVVQPAQPLPDYSYNYSQPYYPPQQGGYGYNPYGQAPPPAQGYYQYPQAY